MKGNRKKNAHGLDFLFRSLPSNVASPVTAPAVASIVCLFRGLPSKTKSGHLLFCLYTQGQKLAGSAGITLAWSTP